MKVNGKDDIPYMKWEIKAMFETTNQLMILLVPSGYDSQFAMERSIHL
jgi:hypothetical protein